MKVFEKYMAMLAQQESVAEVNQEKILREIEETKARLERLEKNRQVIEAELLGVKEEIKQVEGYENWQKMIKEEVPATPKKTSRVAKPTE